MSAEVLHCPACGEEISRHNADPVIVRGRVSSRAPHEVTSGALAHMMAEADYLHFQAVAVTEEKVRRHFESRHRFRYWVYRKTGWIRALSFAGAKW